MAWTDVALCASHGSALYFSSDKSSLRGSQTSGTLLAFLP